MFLSPHPQSAHMLIFWSPNPQSALSKLFFTCTPEIERVPTLTEAAFSTVEFIYMLVLTLWFDLHKYWKIFTILLPSFFWSYTYKDPGIIGIIQLSTVRLCLLNILINMSCAEWRCVVLSLSWVWIIHADTESGDSTDGQENGCHASKINFKAKNVSWSILNTQRLDFCSFAIFVSPRQSFVTSYITYTIFLC